MKGYNLDSFYFERGIDSKALDLIFVAAHYNDDDNRILEGEMMNYHYIVSVDTMIIKYDTPAAEMLQWAKDNKCAKYVYY